MTEAYIVAYGRSPICKGKEEGTYYYSKPEEIAAQVLRGVLTTLGESFPTHAIEDVIVGCSVPENLQGMNIARKISLLAGLDVCVPGQTINRFCASGLQSIATAAAFIQSQQADLLIAGGLEFASTTPATGPEMTNSLLLESSPNPYSPWMGITAENVAQRYSISSEEQNRFALTSHEKAHLAQVSGKFEEEIIPVVVQRPKRMGSDIVLEDHVIDKDEGIRTDSSIEKLEHLPKIFKKEGTVTAATSSQISDGAAFVVLASPAAVKRYQLKPLARFLGCHTTGCEPALMGLGPITAIPKVLEKTGLKQKDIDLIELNEAFAAQALACIKALNLADDKVNVNGGAIALGHPNGATGTVLTIKALSELKRRRERYGLISMCVGGGMGAAGIIENLGAST